MKKLLFLFSAIVLFSSCSSDDSSGSKTKLVKKIATSGSDEGDNRSYTFTYDNKDRVKKMKVVTETSSYEMTYTYNEIDYITKAVRTGDQAGTSLVTYDANNRLQTISSSEGVFTFTFDDNTQTYTMMGQFPFRVDSGWDFLSYYQFAIESEGQKKGPFANVKGNIGILQFLGMTDFIFLGGRRNVNRLTVNGQEAMVKISVYDEQDLVTEANVGGVLTTLSVVYKY